MDPLFLLLDIVKDLPPVTDVCRGQSVVVCGGATSGCDIGEEVKVNGSHITSSFATSYVSSCFVIKYKVDNADYNLTTAFKIKQISDCYAVKYNIDDANYNLTVRIEFFYSNFISSVSSNTTIINVKGYIIIIHNTDII